MSTSMLHINNMYIKYTFVDVASLLICQALRVVPLLVTIPLVIEALSLKFGSSLGFLHGSGNCLAILLEVPFISLALLENGGLINHQHLMLFLDLYLRSLKHHEELRDHFLHPLHIIVHHETLMAWWSDWKTLSIIFLSGRLTPT